jgi:hypothetical protein
VHPMLIGQRTDRQPLNPMIPPDHRELLHLRPHPPDPTFVTTRSGPSGTHVITVSWGQSTSS